MECSKQIKIMQNKHCIKEVQEYNKQKEKNLNTDIF